MECRSTVPMKKKEEWGEHLKGKNSQKKSREKIGGRKVYGLFPCPYLESPDQKKGNRGVGGENNGIKPLKKWKREKASQKGGGQKRACSMPIVVGNHVGKKRKTYLPRIWGNGGRFWGGEWKPLLN